MRGGGVAFGFEGEMVAHLFVEVALEGVAAQVVAETAE
jgi:hypothetical protein